MKKAFPKIQFVATTHSITIVQSLKKEELINLDDTEGLNNDPFKYSIEEIAEVEMGVENVPRSKRFQEIEDVAGQYYTLIAEGKTSKTNGKVAILRQKLNELEEVFSDDPAFVEI